MSILADHQIKAPFPWFGGKSRAAQLVWSRLGDVANYVEPFFGSGAVLLGRPTLARIETVNDLDGFVTNFWRSVVSHPDQVAYHADQPVHECDLHARHIYLVNARKNLTARLMGDPEYCDPKLAGWWAWGACTWIGSGWCQPIGPWQSVDGFFVKGEARGVNRQIPHLADAGRGVNRSNIHIREWIDALSERMRRVRVICGDWSRVIAPSVTTRHGLTGVFLDPPYSNTGNSTDVYGIKDEVDLSEKVRQWCITSGNNPQLRIAICGYAPEHDELEEHGWERVGWKARKGYQKDNTNTNRETIWFSPACLKPDQGFLGGKE